MAVPLSPLISGKVEGPAAEALSGNRGPKKKNGFPVASGNTGAQESGSPVSEFLKVIQDLFAGKGTLKKNAGVPNLPVTLENKSPLAGKDILGTKKAPLQAEPVKKSSNLENVVLPPKLLPQGVHEGSLDAIGAAIQKKSRTSPSSDTVSAKETKETKQKNPLSLEGGREKKSTKELLDNANGLLVGAFLQNSPSKGTQKPLDKNSRVGGDNEGPGVAKTESKKKDKRTDRLELEVYDLRTGASRPPTSANGLAQGKESKDGTEKNTDLVIKLQSSVPADSQGPDKSSAVPSSSLDFQNALARELRDSGNADIVRHASMVLKDNNQGVILLSLQPESLGTVKIRLEMADDKIAGHIVVQTPEALRAFESEIRSLEQAFRDGGFGGASLDVSVSADGGGNQNGGQNPRESAEPFFSERWAAKTYDGAAPSVYVPIPSQDRTSNLMSINLLA